MKPQTRPLWPEILTFSPEHPKRDQKSEIYTPKRDDEHPRPFHLRSPRGKNHWRLTLLQSLVSQDNLGKVQQFYYVQLTNFFNNAFLSSMICVVVPIRVVPQKNLRDANFHFVTLGMQIRQAVSIKSLNTVYVLVTSIAPFTRPAHKQ